MYEGIKRKKGEKIAFARLLGNLLGPLSGMDQEKITLYVSEYAEEVYQLKYNWEYQVVRSRVAHEQKTAQDEDLRILERVAAMTVKEDTPQNG